MDFKCAREDCFACRVGRCKLLERRCNTDPCPFYKSYFQLEGERQAVIERLHKIHRKDLIKYYTSNERGYEL